jgi:hypothetical protein
MVAEEIVVVALSCQLHCFDKDFFDGLHNQFWVFPMDAVAGVCLAHLRTRIEARQ